ncbi:glycosyltransferase [Jeotgalibacillus aurantiacus]|uniref:glycosyltransferase n=1 Tax=Jeotgalibacillus aurantiacus TaxID=2763266 RepID=UPI001D09C526|nr:glycosyltransferase [Jeotgalibacillus aurantiacus]
MNEPVTVSIVVPVYKVEAYIRRCLDSLSNQTYPHLQIIVVNDGSPDQSGEIAEEYARLDSRIEVVHQLNQGLSGARNTGIQYAHGFYSMYVDSDDWIEINAVEKMLHLALETKADIVQSNFYYAYENRNMVDYRFLQKERSPTVLSNEEAVRELVSNKKVKNFAWGKMYRTTLIKNIPFQEGRLFEDVVWAYRVMENVSLLVLVSEPLYYYMQRSTSITADYTPRNLDFIKGLTERHEMMKVNYPGLADASNRELLRASLLHYHLLFFHRKKDEKGYHRKELRRFIDERFSSFEQAASDEPHLYRQLKFFHYHPFLNLCFLGLRKGFRKLKLIPSPEGLQPAEPGKG